MSTVPAAPARAPEAAPPGRDPSSRHVLALVAIIVALGAALVLRFAVTSELWLDEALTVNIARLPLGDLHTALERDGAPPLFYVLLHIWTGVFGDGRVAVRTLPALISLAAFVPAWFVGRRLARRAPEAMRAFVPWALILLLASSPYAIRFATEVRMYSLTILLVLLGQLALARVFDRPTIGRAGVLGLAVAALLSSQYWALYLLAVVGLALIWMAWRGAQRHPAQRHAALVAIGGLVFGGVLFLPWIPTFLSQTAHTGTPWGTAPPLPTGLAFAFIDFASVNLGEAHAEAWLLALPLLLLVLLGVFGVARGNRSVELDLRTRPPVRWEGVVLLGTLLLGLAASVLADTAFQARYAAVVFPLYLVCAAFGLTVFADRRLRVAVLTILVLIGLVGGVRNAVLERTQAGDVAAKVKKVAEPGAVVAYCPDQVAPDVARLLPSNLALRQLTFPDGNGPKFVNWVDYKDRNAAADPAAFAARVLDRAGPNGQIFLVWQGGYRTLETSCEQVVVALQAARPGATYLLDADPASFERQNLMLFPPTS